MKERKKMNKLKLLSVVTSAAVFSSIAFGFTANQKPLAAASSKNLVIYTALQQGDMSWIQSKFKQDTGINITYTLYSAGDLETKVASELGNPQADVMLGGSCEYYEDLDPKNAFVKYTAPNAKQLGTQFMDPKGYWQGWYLGVLAMFYNTDRFKELAAKGLKAPQTWDDLLDSRYKGQFITSNPATAGGAYIFTACQLFRLGDTKGWDYLSKLNKNVDHYVKGADDPIALVATGQFTIGMSWAHDIQKSAVKLGYPVKIVIPKDTAFEIGGAAVIKGSANQANAKTFIKWLLTRPVQQANTNYSNRYSVRTDVAVPTGMPALKNVKLVKYNRQQATAEKNSVIDKFTQMIGQ
jgi:ABC-type Fe3+ transport system, periplasmic component